MPPNLPATLTADLLTRGFLPRELPPCFTSASLGPWLRGSPLHRAEGTSAPMVFHLVRQGMLRRRLSIPNPIDHRLLCEHLGASQSILSTHLDSALWFSPLKRASRRALERGLDEAHILERRAWVRATSRYIVQADIANFYGTLYTHTLEWAVVGKAEAKARLQKASTDPAKDTDYRFSSKLDRLVRKGQLNQSVGIPIGPDASLLLAELVACAADRSLLQRHGRPIRGFRHVDDYELGASTLHEAESLLATLQGVLREGAELELNPRKTRIVELPVSLEAPWVTELKGIVRESDTTTPSGARAQRRDLLRLLDRATALRAAHPDEHVLRYAAGVLRHYKVHSGNWAVVRDWMLQSMLSEPGVLSVFLQDLLCYQQDGRDIAREDLLSVLHQLILRHAPAGHSSEVAWALWAYIELGAPLDASAQQAVEAMDDPICSLIAHHLRSEGLFGTSPAFTGERHNEAAELWGPHWMLTYEARAQGWLSAPGVGSDPLSCPAFKSLFDAGVRFYDPTRRIDAQRFSSPTGYP